MAATLQTASTAIGSTPQVCILTSHCI